MGEQKRFSVCKCGSRYRSDGAYAKEACAGCLPALRGYVRTPQQAVALAAMIQQQKLEERFKVQKRRRSQTVQKVRATVTA